MDQSIAMAILKDGLQKNNLLFFLEKKYPKNFVDMLARADGYARMEEAFKAKDGEAIGDWRTGESSKSSTEGRPSEARSCFQTPFECKRAELLGLEGKEVWTEGHDGAPPSEGSITMLPSML